MLHIHVPTRNPWYAEFLTTNKFTLTLKTLIIQLASSHSSLLESSHSLTSLKSSPLDPPSK